MSASIGSPSDAAVSTDIPATAISLLKGIAIAIVAGLPAALGRKAAAASSSVALCTEDAAKVPALGSTADATSTPVTMSAEDKAKVAALGVAVSAAAAPVVLASDDAQLAKRFPLIDFSAVPVRTALSVASAEQASGLAIGTWLARCNAPCYLLQGATGLTAIAAGAGESPKMEAGVLYIVEVTNATTKGFLAAIVDASTATLQVWATL